MKTKIITVQTIVSLEFETQIKENDKYKSTQTTNRRC